jgi:hypothetical protein
LYRSMWTIGRSQRVEEKKYRPIVRKILDKKVITTYGQSSPYK